MIGAAGTFVSWPRGASLPVVEGDRSGVASRGRGDSVLVVGSERVVDDGGVVVVS